MILFTVTSAVETWLVSKLANRISNERVSVANKAYDANEWRRNLSDWTLGRQSRCSLGGQLRCAIPYLYVFLWRYFHTDGACLPTSKLSVEADRPGSGRLRPTGRSEDRTHLSFLLRQLLPRLGHLCCDGVFLVFRKLAQCIQLPV